MCATHLDSRFTPRRRMAVSAMTERAVGIVIGCGFSMVDDFRFQIRIDIQFVDLCFPQLLIPIPIFIVALTLPFLFDLHRIITVHEPMGR
jgi:hypothetical protein